MLSLTSKQARRTLVCGVVLIVLGLVCIVGAVFLYVYVPRAIEQQVSKTLIISSPDHPEYNAFVSNDQADAPPKYNYMYFYSVDNREAFLAGQPPRITEVGPYVFQERYKHHNVK